MKQLQLVLQQHRLYFSGLVIVLAISTVLLISLGNGSGTLSVNSEHPFWLNVFFINYTFIGNGIFASGLAAVFIYFKRNKDAVTLLATFIFSAVFIQLSRNFTLSSPDLYLEQGQYLFTGLNSIANPFAHLPSGHTSNAFAIATMLMITLKNKRLQPWLLVLAVLVGFSRIYLAQHSLSGVITGALVGTFCGIGGVLFSSLFFATKAQRHKGKAQNIAASHHNLKPSL